MGGGSGANKFAELDAVRIDWLRAWRNIRSRRRQARRQWRRAKIRLGLSVDTVDADVYSVPDWTGLGWLVACAPLAFGAACAAGGISYYEIPGEVEGNARHGSTAKERCCMHTP